MYVYKEEMQGNEPVFVVGFYDPKGEWHPELDHDTYEEAAERVAWLNGSGNTTMPAPTAVEKEEEEKKEELKQIDWSKVNFDVVPVTPFSVKDFKNKNTAQFIKGYKKTDSNSFYDNLANWKYATLITGKRIAWDGGECPLPEGVIVRAWLRDGGIFTDIATDRRWNPVKTLYMPSTDIIAFQIIGLADGYREGWEEDA